MIVKTSSIGDVVHALPIAQLIKNNLPGTKIGWVVRQRCAQLLAGNPNIDRIHVLPSRPSFDDLATLSKSLKREAYQTCLDMQGLALSGLIALLSGAQRRVGLDLNREQNRIFLTEPIVAGHKGDERHAIDILRGFLPAIGIDANTDWPTLSYLPEPASRLLPQFAIGQKTVALNVGASSIYKQWPAKNWASLCQASISKGLVPILLGGSAEQNIVGEIKQQVTGFDDLIVDAIGKTTLREAAWLMRNALATVTGDSGLMHIAVAVGAPVVALFGSTNPHKTGPYGERNCVIWPNIACAPCFRHPTCKGRVDCMKMISVGRVMSNVETLIDAGKKSAR